MDEVLSRQLGKQLEDMPVLDENDQLIGAINLSHVLRQFRSDKDEDKL
jgi:Mg/Co/Ni transporter MgtE